MVEQVLINADDYPVPDANQLITEDDTPIDNFASARQQRLLVGSLYSVLPTGDELAQRERLEKEQAQKLAQQERLEKEQAQQRAQLLA